MRECVSMLWHVCNMLQTNCADIVCDNWFGFVTCSDCYWHDIVCNECLSMCGVRCYVILLLC